MKTWFEQYAEESGDTQLKRAIARGYDMRAAIREHAMRRWFPHAWHLSRTAHYEERASPRPEALDLHNEVAAAVQIVNEFQLGEAAPIKVELFPRVVRVLESNGKRFTGCVAVVRMVGLEDLHLAWSAEERLG